MSTYHFRYPSDRCLVAQVETLLRRVPEIDQLDTQRRFNLIVATMEAVANAVEHGNQSDPTKNVEIWVEVTDDAIRVHVRDYGNGFEPTTLPDPRTRENILREGGRGVFLMGALVDQVEFVRCKPGTEAIITLYR